MARRPRKLRINANSNVHKQESAIYYKATVKTYETAAEPRFAFFKLPRELRDEIYMQYCSGSPRTRGPLEGYAEIPSPAPLAVSKQMRKEISPVFYESLKHILLQDRVLLKLQSATYLGRTRYVGWSIWAHNWGSTGRSFNIWVRDGDEEEGKYARWWVDARNLESLKYIKFDVPSSHTETSPQGFEQLVECLENLQVVTPMIPKPLAVSTRLNILILKVNRRLVEVKKEAEKARTKLKTVNGHPDESTMIGRSGETTLVSNYIPTI